MLWVPEFRLLLLVARRLFQYIAVCSIQPRSGAGHGDAHGDAPHNQQRCSLRGLWKGCKILLLRQPPRLLVQLISC